MAHRRSNISDKLEALKAKMESIDIGGEFQQGFWKPEEGRNIIRILPEVGEMEFFFQEVGRHFNLPDVEDADKTLVCPDFTTGGEEPCPICEVVQQLYSSGSVEDKELASKWRVRKSFWMNVVVRKAGDRGGNTAEGPYIFTPGVMIFQSIQSLISDPDYGDISDLEQGIDIIIDRNGTGIDTSYKVYPRKGNFHPIHEDADQSSRILNEAVDLSYVLLTENPDEDEEYSGVVVKVLPYNRIVDMYGIGPNEELEFVEDAEHGKEDEEDEVGSEIRERRARRSRRK